MIKVKVLTKKEIEIDIEPTDTIGCVKKRVEEKEGIPPTDTLGLFTQESNFQMTKPLVITTLRMVLCFILCV